MAGRHVLPQGAVCESSTTDQALRVRARWSPRHGAGGRLGAVQEVAECVQVLLGFLQVGQVTAVFEPSSPPATWHCSDVKETSTAATPLGAATRSLHVTPWRLVSATQA